MRVALVIVLLIAAGCQHDESQGLSPRTAATIRETTTVQAYRIASPLAPNFDDLKRTHRLISEYPILEEKPVPPTTARRLVAALTDRKTYGDATDCTFDPGYALQFRRGADTVVFVICFKCGDMDVEPSAAVGEPKATLAINGPAPALHATMRELFPDRAHASR